MSHEFYVTVWPTIGTEKQNKQLNCITETSLTQCLGVIMKHLIRSLDFEMFFTDPGHRVARKQWMLWKEIHGVLDATYALIEKSESGNFSQTAAIVMIRRFGARLWGCDPSEVHINTSEGDRL